MEKEKVASAGLAAFPNAPSQPPMMLPNTAISPEGQSDSGDPP